MDTARRLMLLVLVLAACQDVTRPEEPLSPTLMGLQEPFDQAAAGGLAYVVGGGLGPFTLSVIETASHSLVATHVAGDRASDVAVTPDGSLAYIVNNATDDVTIVEATTGAVVATVPVGRFPLGIAITPNGAFAYVANGVDNDVAVIETATNTVVQNIPVGDRPEGITITPDGSLAYVGHLISDDVYAIDLATNTVVAVIPTGDDTHIAPFTPDGAFAYAVQQFSSSVSVIDVATHTIVATIPVGTQPTHAAVSLGGAFVYVSSIVSEDVSVIDTRTNTVTTTIDAGPNPQEMAVTLDGAFLYVVNGRGQGPVTVVSIPGHSVVSTIPLPRRTFPASIAIAPDPSPPAALVLIPRSQDATSATFRAEWSARRAPYVWDARALDRANGPNQFGVVQDNAVTFTMPRVGLPYQATFQVWEQLAVGGYNQLGTVSFTVP